ncbi:MAG: CNNM domain-containing protein, partial [Mariprofundaceae bacterium]
MNELLLSLPTTIAILFLLLLLSAFFSGSETALTRARRVRLKLLSDQGNEGAKRAEALLRQPERMLSVILLGNNFVNIAASALATAMFMHAFGEAGILYATIAMTIVVLIFSEILPKSIAIAHSEKIACQVAAPLQWIQRILSPIVTLLMSVIHWFQRVFRVPEGNNPTAFTHQELATMIDMSAEGGMLDAAREQMLMSSLGLHDVPVKSLMTPRKEIVALDASKSVIVCKQTALHQPHSRYPVFLDNSDNILGIVHLRDLIKKSDSEIPLAHAMIWR